MKRFLGWAVIIAAWGGVASARDFVHPGALSSQAELEFVAARIRAGDQPWRGELDRIASSGYAARRPHGREEINSRNEDVNASRDDAIASYTQALLWRFTGNEAYANRSIAILNSWSRLQRFTAGNDQDRLQAGWVGSLFGSAAELMRGYPGWTPGEIGNLQTMFRRAFYPQLNAASSWNGNVDLTQIDAMMAIAVFNEDEVELSEGIRRLRVRSRAYFYLTSDGLRPPSIDGDGGNLPAFWSHPSKWIDGMTQETCRDNGHHSQFGLGSALHAAEIAWHQGVDVYAEHQERYTAAMELLASQFLTGKMQGVCRNEVASRTRFDTWEIGYNHYHNRRGIDLSHTERLIREQVRPDAPRAVCNLAYETLTHAEVSEGSR